MRHLPILPLLMLPLALAAQGPAAVPAPATTLPPADNCGPIRQQIEQRFRAGGVQPALAVVDAGLGAGGRIVGTCGNGRRQIVLLGQAAVGSGGDRPAARRTDAEDRAENRADRPVEAPAERPAEREPADKIPTECKDGSIVIGPHCDDPRAVRMTSAELAASLAPARPASGEVPARPASR